MSTIVITGASSGIGAAAARELARLGHRIGVVGRNPERTRAIAAETEGDAFLADFDRLEDVRRLADELAASYERIDVLANNAGAIMPRRGFSADGVVSSWQHNVLAPFVLTTRLLPLLMTSSARVLFTASAAHWGGGIHLGDLERRNGPWVGGFPAYGAAKRADMMLARELARRTGLASYSFHPGLVATRFGDTRGLAAALLHRVAITPEEGAAPLVLLASATEVPAENGAYFDRLHPRGRMAAQVRDDAVCRDLWDALERQAAGAAA